MTLPRRIMDLELMIIVWKKRWKGSSYDFTIRKQIIMDVLLYKIQNDPYYKYVQADYNALEE